MRAPKTATLVCLVFFALASAAHAQESHKLILELQGRWGFRLDPTAIGEKENWATATLPNQIQLPGSLQNQGFGDDPSSTTHWIGKPWLMPKKHYVGQAWYSNDVEIPADWANQSVILVLERCHWQTTVWVDGKKAGSADSLSTADEFDLTQFMTPGKHHLVLQIDNSIKIPIGDNSQSISDATQTDWNGVAGEMQLEVHPKVRITDVQIFPNVSEKKMSVRVTISNKTGSDQRTQLTLQAIPSDNSTFADSVQRSVSLNGETTTETIEYAMGTTGELWTQFSPNLYRLDVTAETTIGTDVFDDDFERTFGLRELAQQGTQFTINHKPIMIRGTDFPCVFPDTGYPMASLADIKDWEKIFMVAKSYGFNEFRFPTWCPPDAAFEAADRQGFFLHVEGPAMPDATSPEAVKFQSDEITRIERAYGNHPSFCFIESNSSSLTGKADPRFQIIGGLSGGGDVRLLTADRKLDHAPESQFDLSTEIHASSMPTLATGIGQWATFPDLEDASTYAGFLTETPFDELSKSLADHHLSDQARGFLLASGQLQTTCEKEEIESVLRTPGLAGFEVAGMTDFAGEGLSPFGILNSQGDPKGYISGLEFKRFAGPTVPLAVMDRRVFTNKDMFRATIKLADYGEDAMQDAWPQWTIRNKAGSTFADGALQRITLIPGGLIDLGQVIVPLSSITRATHLILAVSVKGEEISNQWDFWVYPANEPTKNPGILEVSSLDNATVNALNSGGKVLLLASPASVKNDPAQPIRFGFSPLLRNTSVLPAQPTNTLGILCNPQHPAFADFPTESFGDWQWWSLETHAQPMILDNLDPSITPIVQAIDDWNANRKLALVFEANVGKGKLIVCSIDLSDANDPVKKQLYSSLLRYMASNEFTPRGEATAQQIQGLFQK